MTRVYECKCPGAEKETITGASGTKRKQQFLSPALPITTPSASDRGACSRNLSRRDPSDRLRFQLAFAAEVCGYPGIPFWRAPNCVRCNSFPFPLPFRKRVPPPPFFTGPQLRVDDFRQFHRTIRHIADLTSVPLRRTIIAPRAADSCGQGGSIQEAS